MSGREYKSHSSGAMNSIKVSSHRFNRVWLTIETALLATVIIIFNLLALDVGPMGIVTSAAEQNSFVPLVAPGIKSLVPWFNLWLGSAFIINLVNLLRGRWHPLTRLADLGTGIVGIGVLAATIVIGPVLALEPTWAAGQTATGLSLEPIENTLLPLINTSLFIAIVIALVSLLAATIRKVAYMVKSWRPEESEIRATLHIGIGLAIVFTLSGPLTLIFGEFVYLGLGVPLGLGLGILINRQFSESRA